MNLGNMLNEVKSYKKTYVRVHLYEISPTGKLIATKAERMIRAQ